MSRKMSGLQRNSLKVKLFQKAVTLANRLAALPNKLVPPPFRLIQMGSAYWQSRALYTAADLGIADALGEAQRGVDEIATELGLHTDHLYRLLRMLASLGVFEERSPGEFRNNKLSACLCKDHPQSVRAMVLLHNSPEIGKAWFDSLTPAMRSGEVPFVLSHGEELYSYMNNHPRFDALFSEAMEAVEGLTGNEYLDDFDWGRFARVIDVGGSIGKKSIAILQRNPGLRVLVFDRSAVVANAEEYWREKLDPALFEQLEFRGGDMLEAIPQADSDSDLYLFVAVFHGMGKEEARRVLGNLKSACGDHRPGIVIADMVAQTMNIDSTIAGFDMQMLTCTQGRERTLEEWRELVEPVGFRLQEIVQVRTFARLLVLQIAE